MWEIYNNNLVTWSECVCFLVKCTFNTTASLKFSVTNYFNFTQCCSGTAVSVCGNNGLAYRSV